MLAPDLSLVITNRNYGRYLLRLIRSLQHQQGIDKSSLELVIVDDASDDSSSDLYPTLERSGIRVIRNSESLGSAGAANKGILESTGRFVGRIDADDYVSEWYCAILLQAQIMNEGLLGVSCDYWEVDAEGVKIRRRSYEEQPLAAAIIYDREKLIEEGLYNASNRYGEEIELRHRLGSAYKTLNIPIPLYRYRRHESNKTNLAAYQIATKIFGGDPGVIHG